jgi:ribonucleotide reductase beta subunit family protein with ferritin-like domain
VIGKDACMMNRSWGATNIKEESQKMHPRPSMILFVMQQNYPERRHATKTFQQKVEVVARQKKLSELYKQIIQQRQIRKG